MLHRVNFLAGKQNHLELWMNLTRFHSCPVFDVEAMLLLGFPVRIVYIVHLQSNRAGCNQDLGNWQ